MQRLSYNCWLGATDAFGRLCCGAALGTATGCFGLAFGGITGWWEPAAFGTGPPFGKAPKSREEAAFETDVTFGEGTDFAFTTGISTTSFSSALDSTSQTVPPVKTSDTNTKPQLDA